MTKIIPALGPSLFTSQEQTYEEIGVRMNPSLEGISPLEAELRETIGGVRVMRSLEFDLVGDDVVAAFNAIPKDEIVERVVDGKTIKMRRRQAEIAEMYAKMCALNCVGCYAKSGMVFSGEYDLLRPDAILDIIQQATETLGTRTVKFMGPGDLLRDPRAFEHLDRLQAMGVTVGIFTKDPMLGDDAEVAKTFGRIGITTSEQLVERLAQYSNLRILFNFRSFDDDITNSVVRDGFEKENYSGDYKRVQNRALGLLYEHFTRRELADGKEGRLVVLNAPIESRTIDEAVELFTYFMDRGVPVISTTSMQSGCGAKLYSEQTGRDEFMDKLVDYYAQVSAYTLRRGLISVDEWTRIGPTAYAGMVPCLLGSNLHIRATGHVQRCPGNEGKDWTDAQPEALLERGIGAVWKGSANYRKGVSADGAPVLNMGCPAKPKIFTQEFFDQVRERTLNYLPTRLRDEMLAARQSGTPQ